jgi:hypothetical protein
MGGVTHLSCPCKLYFTTNIGGRKATARPQWHGRQETLGIGREDREGWLLRLPFLT